ncbi:MAG: rRNA ((2251)-2-O)-methyltransferase RlmB [Actinomycetota bacterium]|nr:rRNA ((2251)-2-O)-methyltransferase RlmB [Actinomycetota bacterium]
MAGNSKRQGAVRKSGSKKGAQVGSGGQRRRGLEAKGPTPKATERTAHPAARRARAADRAGDADGASGGNRGRAPRRIVADDIVVGRNPVAEALRAGVPARELLVVDLIDPDDRVAAAVAIAAERGVPVRERPKRELDRAAGEANHQGLVLRTEPFAYADPQELWESALGSAAAPILVALDGITDPHNLGAIARSASAFGAFGVIVPSRRSAGVTPTAWRASAGAFAHLPVARATNLARMLADAAAQGYFVVALDGAVERSIAEVAAHFSDVPVVLVVGSEGSGVSRLIADRADALAAIGMPGRAESLNASVAAGIALFALAGVRGQ